MSNIETLKNRFLQGRLTRREFLTQVSALGLAATLSPAFLSTPARAARPRNQADAAGSPITTAA